jgi:hypothetical protein
MTASGDSSGVQWYHGTSAARARREAELLTAGCPLPVRARNAWARAFPRINTSLVVVEGGGHTAAIGFERQASRALPGHHIARVQRAGASVPPGTEAALVRAIVAEARRDWRTLRLHCECFSRDAEVRERLGAALRAHGFAPIAMPTQYGYTLVTDLAGRDNATHLASLSQGVRQNIRAVAKYPVELKPIRDAADSPRMNALMHETLARTGATHVERNYAPVIAFANAEPDLSRLIGLYRTDGAAQDALIAFAWGLNNVDHVAYDIGASARIPEFKSLSLGYPLLWDLIAWARDHGARWFDYGGVPADDADAAHLERISDFKRRFEKQAVRIADEWVLTPHRARAAVATAVSRAANLLARRRDG